MANYRSLNYGLIKVTPRLDGFIHRIPLMRWVKTIPTFTGRRLKFVIEVETLDVRAKNKPLKFGFTVNDFSDWDTVAMATQSVTLSAKKVQLRFESPDFDKSGDRRLVGEFQIASPEGGHWVNGYGTLVDFDVKSRDSLRLWLYGVTVPAFIALLFFTGNLLAQKYWIVRPFPDQITVVTPTPLPTATAIPTVVIPSPVPSSP